MADSRPASRDADQYRNSGNLKARGNLHARYANRNWFDWVASYLELSPGNDVIDIGSGAGWFWSSAARQVPRDVRLTLIDISEGMVSEAVRTLSANSRFGAVVGRAADAVALPFPDHGFDVAIAMHMLYHVPECEQALDEIVRLLRPGGLAAITTNGDDNLRQLFDLGSKAFGGASTDPAPQAFGIARARDLLALRFDSVAVHRFEDTYAISDAEDVFRYLTSFPPGNRAAEPKRTKLRRLIEERLRHGDGVLKVTREGGLVCARGPRQQQSFQ